MATTTSFIELIAGQWVPVCAQRPTRQALMMQTLSGSAILSMTTAAPDVSGTLGTTPAGILQSISAGNGPGLFRLSEAFDNEMVTQEWYAWLVPIGGPPPGVVEILNVDDGNTFGGGPVSLALSYDTTAPVMIIVTWNIITGNSPATLTSDRLGLLTPVETMQIVNGAGNFSDLQVFTYSWGLGADILTAACGFDGVLFMWIFAVGGGVGFDVTGTDSGAGNPVHAGTTSPTTTTKTVALAAIANSGFQYNTVPWVTPWNFINAGNLFDQNGDSWGAEIAWADLTALAPVSVSVSPGPDSGDWMSIVVTVSWDATTTPAVMTVIESFDVPALDQSPEKKDEPTITADLPRLSRKGVTALHNLLARIREKEQSPDENTNQTEHDHPDDRQNPL